MKELLNSIAVAVQYLSKSLLWIANSLDSYSGDILLALNVNGNSVCLSVFMCVTTFAVMHQALQKNLFWKFINKKQYFDLIKGV